ncbi:MAG: hypothetical protein WCT77_00300 [Bacteroidota bacterium]
MNKPQVSLFLYHTTFEPPVVVVVADLSSAEESEEIPPPPPPPTVLAGAGLDEVDGVLTTAGLEITPSRGGLVAVAGFVIIAIGFDSTMGLASNVLTEGFTAVVIGVVVGFTVTTGFTLVAGATVVTGATTVFTITSFVSTASAE